MTGLGTKVGQCLGHHGGTWGLPTAGLFFLQVLKGWGEGGLGGPGGQSQWEGSPRGGNLRQTHGQGLRDQGGAATPRGPPRPGRRAWRPSVVGLLRGRERGWGAGRMPHPRIRWAKGCVAKLKRMVHLRKETVSAPSQTHQAKTPQIQGESVKSQSQWEAVIPLSQNLTSQEGNK